MLQRLQFIKLKEEKKLSHQKKQVNIMVKEKKKKQKVFIN